MSQRLEKFHSFSKHAWLQKVYARLKKSDLSLVEGFILEHDHLDKEKFELAVNRMFLEKEKPKNWTLVLELLSNSNSGVL